MPLSILTLLAINKPTAQFTGPPRRASAGMDEKGYATAPLKHSYRSPAHLLRDLPRPAATPLHTGSNGLLQQYSSNPRKVTKFLEHFLSHVKRRKRGLFANAGGYGRYCIPCGELIPLFVFPQVESSSCTTRTGNKVIRGDQHVRSVVFWHPAFGASETCTFHFPFTRKGSVAKLPTSPQ